jgi:hypothetical protein
VNGLLIGLILVLLGIYFNSAIAMGIGFLCVAIMLYSTKSVPVREPITTERKTKHTVVMSEPPEEPFIPQMMGQLPIGRELIDQQGFLPLPNYGYSDPLEKILLGFPVKFWKK